MSPPSVGAAAACAPAAGGGRILWGRSLAWLALLGPFFFLSYGYANGLAAARGVSEAVYFGWERAIPFLAWTIVPYWSIDLLYGLSFLYCRDRRVVDRHALRLLTAQCVSVTCFLLFPLRFAFDRPPTDGLFGTLFDLLAGFDQPYNQAPSLHIGLLVIIWLRCALGSRGLARWAVHGWMALIGVSVLTTYQHHFIDVPTGALVGLLCVWLWPDEGRPPLAGWRTARDPARWRLAAVYGAAALVLAVLAVVVGGGALWLCWPAVSLALLALAYLGLGGQALQNRDGRHGVAAALLFGPYLIAAWLNSRWWTRRRPQADAVADGVWLGRLPTAADMRASGHAALVDLAPELPAPRGNWHYAGYDWLDLVVPAPEALAAVARRIETLRSQGPLRVCCALGYSRSASAVAAWLLLTGRAADVDAAIAIVRRARPGVVLGAGHRAALAACVAVPEADRD